MIFKEFKMYIKLALSEKNVLFWQMIFPLLLCITFYFVFKNLDRKDLKIKADIDKENPFYSIYEKDVPILDVESGKYKEDDSVIGYVDKENVLHLRKTGLQQMVLASLTLSMDRFKVFAKDSKGIDFSKLDFQKNYLDDSDSSNGQAGIFNLIFYSLIAMVTYYSYYFGVSSMYMYDPKKSAAGLRRALSPVKNYQILSGAFLSSILLSFVSVTIIIFTIMFVLKLNIIKNIMDTFLIITSGILFGNAVGLVIGTVPKINDSIKITLGTFFILAMSFLSGMSPTVKRVVETSTGINLYNPVSIVCDNLIRINVLSDKSNMLKSMAYLIIMSGIMYFIALYNLRRRQYESI